MVTISQIKSGILQYIDKEILPHLSTAKQFGVGIYMLLLMSLILNKVTLYLNMPAVKILNLSDEHNNINIDRLRDVAMLKMNNIDRILISLPVVGSFYFNKSDIDSLYLLIRRS